MKLPDIDPSTLPEHVQEMIGNGAAWQSLHEEDFLIRMPVSNDAAGIQKRHAQVMLVAYRKYAENSQAILKRLEKKKITEEEAKELLTEAHRVVETLKERQKHLYK